MPDRDVKTIKDLIYYQYAKIIAKRAFATPDGQSAKSQNYGFIKKTFLELKKGIKSWSEITREDWQLIDSEKVCVYCGSKKDLQKEHIVPKSVNIKPTCYTCDKIQGIHNQIWACKTCNAQKSDMGLYEFYKSKNPDEKKYYDFIPPLLEKKYLKTIINCHDCAGLLEKGDIDGDGELTVLDIDRVLTK